MDQGYQSEIRDEAGGQVSYCLFPDGSECEEWAFYRGECAPAGESQAAPGQLANPTSENCAAVGGTWTIENRVGGGQLGICLFEDNMQCEEWALLRGDCPVGGVKVTGYVTPAAAYCAITGGEYAVTGNSGADDEQGTCTFKDGTSCDVWEYYDGQCTPGSASTAGEGGTIRPLPEEVCNGQAQAMFHALDDLIPTVTEEPLDDWGTGASGTGCQVTITGTGVQFESPSAAVTALGSMLAAQGWTADPMLVADGPTGTVKGYRNGDQVCLAAAMWEPDASANCPQDQPISACQLTPEQQLYTVTLNCGVETAAGQSATPAGAGLLVFDSTRGGDYRDLYVMDRAPLEGGTGGYNMSRLTRGEADSIAGPWSPAPPGGGTGGTRIVYTSFGLTTSDIWVMNADGSDPVNLTNTSDVDEGFPAWSPDGTHIAFTSRRDGNNEIYVMNADGTNAARWTDNPAALPIFSTMILDPMQQEQGEAAQSSAAIPEWLVSRLSDLLILLLLGGLVLWLRPARIQRPAEWLRRKPLPILGWAIEGIVTILGLGAIWVAYRHRRAAPQAVGLDEQVQPALTLEP